MNTYDTVAAMIRQSHGRVMKPCWIANVKELNGIALRSKRTTPRKIECPKEWRPVIEDALRKLRVLPPL